jgi:raffinose/stachyose/melibiose transport system substrate-binding protein
MIAKKRLWGMGVVCLLLASLLAACGDNTSTTGSTSPTTAAAGTATTAAAGTATTAATGATTAATGATTAAAGTATTAAAGSATTQVASSSAPVTINWWHIATTEPNKTMYNDIAVAYMKDHPNVKIVQNVIENASFKSKLTTVMQSGSPPDLFQSWGGGVLFEFAKAGLVKDISSSLQGEWGNSISKSLLDIYSQGGKTYGVPFNMGMVGIWYNKAQFQKAGITAPPATWPEFLDAVKKLKAVGTTPISLGNKEKWPGHFWWVYLAVRQGGKDAFDKAYSQTGSFADPPFIQAGERLKELIALDPFPKGFQGIDFNGQETTMGDGKAAMELMGHWAPSTQAANATDKKGQGDNLGFFPFPSVPGGAGDPADVMGGGDGYAVGKNAPAEAIDFLKYFTNLENQRKLTTAGIIVPVVKGAEEALPSAELKLVQKTAAGAKYFQLYYDQYLPPAVAETVLDATQGLFGGSSTPEQAAKAIQTTASQELKK